MTTPLGDIEICIDGKTIKYTAQNMGVMDRLCLDVDGRFCIKVEFVPDGERHTISCIIKSHIPSDKDGVESGERLELKSFYKGHSKLSIGMEGETGYFADGTRAFDTYDYDTEYLEDGVRYVINEDTKTDRYVFGVAWIENVTDDNDVQTWFGADPTYFR